MVASQQKKPLYLEIITPFPSTMGPCAPCERVMEAQLGAQVQEEMVQGYPPELLEEFQRLVTWVNEIAARFGQSLQIRMVDPQSPEGLWKCLRYGVRRYPAFIVQGQHRIVGWNPTAVEQALGKVQAEQR